MPEQIFTFTDEELAEMLKSGELKVVALPGEEAQPETPKEASPKDPENNENIPIFSLSEDQLIELLRKII